MIKQKERSTTIKNSLLNKTCDNCREVLTCKKKENNKLKSCSQWKKIDESLLRFFSTPIFISNKEFKMMPTKLTKTFINQPNIFQKIGKWIKKLI